MIELFKVGGFCPDTNYLFMGMLLGSYVYLLNAYPSLVRYFRRLC